MSIPPPSDDLSPAAAFQEFLAGALFVVFCFVFSFGLGPLSRLWDSAQGAM